MSEENIYDLVCTPDKFCRELAERGELEFMRAHNHPWVVSVMDTTKKVSVGSTTRTLRDSFRRPKLYCIPLFGQGSLAYVIGRNDTCDIPISLETVSREHAYIGTRSQLTAMLGEDQLDFAQSRQSARYGHREFFVVDNNTVNGTKVDGKRLEPYKPVKPKNGDTIDLGPDCRLRFARGQVLVRFLQNYESRYSLK